MLFEQKGELLPPMGSLCLIHHLLSKSEATVGHLGEKVSNWQTVNKGDSGRAGGMLVLVSHPAEWRHRSTKLHLLSSDTAHMD